MANQYDDLGYIKTVSTGKGIPIGKNADGTPIYMPTDEQLAAVKASDAAEVANGATLVNTPIAKIAGATTANPIVASGQQLQNTNTPKTQFDIQSEINRLAELQKQKSLADLTAKKNASLSSLGAESATIEPQYTQKKSDLSTTNQIQAKNFSEYMATKGQNNASGDNGTNDQLKISSNVALMGGLSGLTAQEQAANDDISRRRTDVENTFNTDVASANAGYDTQSLQNLIDEMKRQEDQSIASNQFDKNYGLNLAGLTGKIDGETTIAGKQLTLQQQQQTLDNAFRGDQLSYQKAQDTLNNEFKTNQFDWQKTQADLDRQFQSGQFDYQKARDLVSDGRYTAEWQQKLDEYAWGKSENNPQFKGQILNNKIAELELKVLPEMQKQQLIQIKKQKAQIGATQPTTQYEKDMQEVKLLTAKAELEKVQENSNVFTADDYAKYIDDTFVSPETFIGAGADGTPQAIKTGKSTISAKDKVALENYLGSLLDKGVSALIVDALAIKYGI